jgi:malonyl-CoA/methylmalonyl-CoA synthetase
VNLFARLAGGFPADRSRTVIEAGDGAAVSFAELLERAGRIATLLKASGVEPGDRVAVQVEKSVSAVALYLAVLQAGAVYVPLNSGYTAAEVGYFLTDAEPKVVICDPEAHAALAPLVARGAWLFTLGVFGEGTLVAQASRLASERALRRAVRCVSRVFAHAQFLATR